MAIVSILLPTYKEPAYLLRSIQSVIHQSFVDWELVVIDDGLTDAARRTLLDCAKNDQRIRIITNPKNLGIQKSLNEGLQKSTGKYIARIDDDDEWIDVKKLAKQIDFLETHEEYVLVGTGVIVGSGEGKELTRYLLPENDCDIRKRMLSKNCFVHSSVMYKKEEALYVGGYNESLDVLHIEDYDLWLKLGCRGKMHNISDYLVLFSLHTNSISAKNRRTQFSRSVALIKKFKNDYPCYRLSVMQAYLRMFLYPIFEVLPMRFKNLFFKLYKQF